MEAALRPLGVTALIARLGELILAGRLEEATRFWSFPCPVEVEGELMVMRDAQALEAFFRHRSELARKAGLLRLIPRIVAIEVPRDGRFRVWLHWIHHFPDRAEEDRTPSVYFMVRRPSGELSIEMMDTVRMPSGARIA